MDRLAVGDDEKQSSGNPGEALAVKLLYRRLVCVFVGLHLSA